MDYSLGICKWNREVQFNSLNRETSNGQFVYWCYFICLAVLLYYFMSMSMYVCAP